MTDTPSDLARSTTPCCARSSCSSSAARCGARASPRGVLGLSGGVDSASCRAGRRGPRPRAGARRRHALPHEQPREPGPCAPGGGATGIRLVEVEITPKIDAYFARRARGEPPAARQQDGPRAHEHPLRPLGRRAAPWCSAPATRPSCFLGYGTIYGDLASRRQSDRRSLQDPGARARRAPRRAGGDRRRSRRAPTSGPGQTDEQELGFSYADGGPPALPDARRAPRGATSWSRAASSRPS